MISPTRMATFPLTCSGAASAAHNGVDVQLVRIDLRKLVGMCHPCRDAAAKLGLIDRRSQKP